MASRGKRHGGGVRRESELETLERLGLMCTHRLIGENTKVDTETTTREDPRMQRERERERESIRQETRSVCIVIPCCRV